MYRSILSSATVLSLAVALACGARPLEPDSSSSAETGDSGADSSESEDASGSDGGETFAEDGSAGDLPPDPSDCNPAEVLPYQVVDAESLPGADRVAIVSGQPNALHILDFGGGPDAAVELPKEPFAVSLSPAGDSAAVGHDGLITFVNLETQGTVTQPIPIDVFDVVLADNGWAYGFPGSGQWTEIVAIEAESGDQAFSGFPSIRERTRAKLSPGGQKMYGANNGLSPSDFERYDILEDASPILVYDSPYHGDYPMCGDIWLSVDGARIFTACGNTFWAADLEHEDMLYAGALEGLERVAHLDQAISTELVASIPALDFFPDDPNADSEVRFFDGEFLSARGVVTLPLVEIDGECVQPHGRYVFFSEAEDQVRVIAEILAGEEVTDTVLLTLDVPE